MKKGGAFFFFIPFFVPEIFTLLYYANKIAYDVISFDSKWCKNTKSVIYLQLLKQSN